MAGGCVPPPGTRGTLTLPVAAGGDKVLLHFIQKSVGDYVPRESVLKALGISAEVCASKPPQVSSDLGRLYLLRKPHHTRTQLSWIERLACSGAELDPEGFRSPRMLVSPHFVEEKQAESREHQGQGGWMAGTAGPHRGR